MAAQIGTVVRVNERGFGFIRLPDGGSKDVFFHFRDLADGLEFGEQLVERRVEFTVIDSEKGPRAVSVRAAR